MGSRRSSFIKSPAVRLKLYELFTDAPNGDITNRSVRYSQGSHRRAVKVRAASIRDAYRPLARQIVSVKNGAGVVSLNLPSPQLKHEELVKRLLPTANR